MFTSLAYKHSPIFIQNVLLSARGVIRRLLREGRDQADLLAEIEQNEFDDKCLGRYSSERLSYVLDQIAPSVPFYKDVTSGQSYRLDDFPFITKTDVKANGEAFIAGSASGVVVKGATSGTTGTPLSIKQNMTSVVREHAFTSRHLKWAGFEAGDKRAWIRGDMIVPLEQKRGPFWRYSWFENMLLLSSFHMSSNNLQGYIDAMVEYGVEVIQAYPSSIVTLAKYLDINDEYYPSELKSIVTSSESLSIEDKRLVEKRFRCTVFDWYGLFERVAAIGSCEHGRYHILSDYSRVELIKAGEGRYEIVGTNFNNTLQPLIRYRTGDHVYLSTESSCPCGRVFPIIDRIEGRVGDYLVGEDGQKIHILNHIPKGVEGLLATQFVQDNFDEVKVLAVVDRSVFKDTHEKQLIENTKARVGKSLTVTVEIVDSLIRTNNGKIRQAICNL
ncbi:phenylacetate--CoA ligase family protein [Vibrio sp. 16]|uniref:phenylacetate--CoA ligase family protein n=1 Tax=Vibrio sp. 16 TaxID=391586 RepID=UPI002FF3FA98